MVDLSKCKLPKDIVKTNKSKAKVNKLSWKKETNDAIDDLASKIVPTIYKFNDKVITEKDREFLDEYGNKVVMYGKNKTIRKPFILYAVNMFEYTQDFSSIDYKLLNYIIMTIGYNTNTYSFNYEDLANRLSVNVDTVRHYITSFIGIKSNDIIVKTNCNNLYIINHNLIFKGDFEKFKADYYKLYKDINPPIDERGRVLIK